jgi:hypothetical protein
MNFRFLLPVSYLLFASAAAAQVVMTTNATSDFVATFSPVDGSLVSANVFGIPNTVQVSAIQVAGEIWISEQTGDRVVRYSQSGTQIGVIGPTFGTGGLDNIRGMGLINGSVYVTNSGAANGATANSVVVFDTAGNHLQTFSVATFADSPFSVLEFQGNLLVAGSSNNQDVHRFTFAGASLGTFHNSASISFAHQTARASDGNVWCAGFTTGGLSKIDAATGNILQTITAPGARGVYELQNGNLLWTNGTGALVYDFTTQVSTVVLAGSCYHLNDLTPGTLASATPFGTGCDGLQLTTVGLPTLGNANFALLTNNVPLISPIGLVAFGSSALNPGIPLDGVGMVGCFSYTNLDIGLFGGGPAIAGVSAFALPIPASQALAGASLAAQGVTFSLATTLGFASSDGLALVLGY